MRTTREINVDLSKEKLKLRHVTTKDIDVGVRVEPPKQPIKTKSITTTTLSDVADIAEKKRRDDIAVEKKLMIKDEKRIVMAKKEPSIMEKAAKEDLEKAQKIEEEKKLAMKKRMKKVRAAKKKGEGKKKVEEIEQSFNQSGRTVNCKSVIIEEKK